MMHIQDDMMTITQIKAQNSIQPARRAFPWQLLHPGQEVVYFGFHTVKNAILPLQCGVVK